MKKKVFGKQFIEDIDKNEDAFFKISRKNEKAILLVTKEKGNGAVLRFHAITSRLQLFNIQNYDETKVRQVFELADGRFHEIGKWPTEDPINSCVAIKISDSGMQAIIVCSKPLFGGKGVTASLIRSELKKQNITYGIDENEIVALSKEIIYEKEYLIAKGDPPRHGKSGEVKLAFIHTMKPRFIEDAQGNIDLKEMGLYQSVKEGEVLATMEQPTNGVDGKDIFGNTIKSSNGEMCQWNIGKNVILSDSSKHALAAITGRPLLTGLGQIKVDEVIHLEAVDYSTGNVDFVGTIIVDEKIADGFKLSTEGSIIIKQSVGKVNLKAQGDIILAGGFMGRDTGVLESGGKIVARFVERGKLKAADSIFISDAALHSTLIASNMIEVAGRRGEFIGGEAITTNKFLCYKLGAKVETKTKVFAGIPENLLNELDSMQNSIIEYREILSQVAKNINTFEVKKNHNNITEEELAQLEKLEMVKKKYLQLYKNSQEQYETALTHFVPSDDAKIQIEEIIYPGVDINLGKSQTYKVRVKPLAGKSVFKLNHEKKIQRSFK